MLGLAGSMLGILFTFWGMGFLIFRKKGSFFLPRVMWTKLVFEFSGLRGQAQGVQGLGLVDPY